MLPLRIIISSFILLVSFFVNTVFAFPLTSRGIFERVNAERVKEGLTPLTENETLHMVAQERADDMARQQYFSHTTPAGRNFLDGLTKNGYTFSEAGENLAMDFRHDEDVARGWMESVGHRKNILDPRFTETGIGIATMRKDGEASFIAVQIYASQGKPSLFSTLSTTNIFNQQNILATYAHPMTKLIVWSILFAGILLIFFIAKKILKRFFKR